MDAGLLIFIILEFKNRYEEQDVVEQRKHSIVNIHFVYSNMYLRCFILRLLLHRGCVYKFTST